MTTDTNEMDKQANKSMTHPKAITKAYLAKERAEKAEAEVEKLKGKIAERDELVRTSNRLSKEEDKIMQRWKEFGITKEQQLKRAIEIAEEYQRGNSGLHYQCRCSICQMLVELKSEIK